MSKAIGTVRHSLVATGDIPGGGNAAVDFEYRRICRPRPDGQFVRQNSSGRVGIGSDQLLARRVDGYIEAFHRMRT